MLDQEPLPDPGRFNVDPSNPQWVLATTAQGLLHSLDGGMVFTPVPQQPPRHLVMIDYIAYVTGTDRHPSRAGIDDSGGVWSLGASGWQASGALPGVPSAFTVIAPDRYLAATAEEVLSFDDAGSSWAPLAQISS